MGIYSRNRIFAGLMGSTFFILASCGQPLDFDLRGFGSGFNTSGAARNITADRPQADDRGVISYPNYQVAVARPGDRIADIAARIGLPADELGRYNGIGADVILRANEVVALPRRVEEPSFATGAVGAGPIRPQNGIDITSLASDAINRASNTAKPQPALPKNQSGVEPIRHKVEPGETAFSISRLYNVSVRALSDWNGLGPDLAVRSGQYLLIPVTIEAAPISTQPSAPGLGSTTPVPPSAATPLPDTSDAKPVPTPTSPNLSVDKTSASGTSRLAMPVDGKIIRSYAKGRNDGIDIAAAAGSTVRAAADGMIAAITRDTEQVPILVIKHANNLLTVYAGIDGLVVKKGDKVKRGQKIAEIRAGNPSFLHFEVRQGLDSVDPVAFLN
ncbi:MAG: peptidoglycan DD-metalloendopeptidase family protein [Paracoccaceae bacterium]